MKDSPDFIAELHYRTPNEGGRHSPAFSGYRPQLKFPFSEMQTSGKQVFIGVDEVLPGSIVKAEITMLSPHFFSNTLFMGLNFEFREGSQIIGTGVILNIINKNLLVK